MRSMVSKLLIVLARRYSCTLRSGNRNGDLATTHFSQNATISVKSRDASASRTKRASAESSGNGTSGSVKVNVWLWPGLSCRQ